MNKMKVFEKQGFIVKQRNTVKGLSDEITQRYINIPKSYLNFLDQFDFLSNKEETFWFNSIGDFNYESDIAFKWNDFEIQSLDAFEGDIEEQKRIRDFWDKHLIIALSVKGEYQYLAICLNEENYGAIVYGAEPEFEESERVCENFEQLLTLFTNPKNNEHLSLLV
ncbi:SMI1/KNR4 family protein [Marinifilum sp. N1E240]|uniref:SMI1/KNR4 family protein n=1 Tax=Marinifilum sp. N1E240 TaxID=2608082 RepID=UPI00128B7C0E|nr:SMI1/KNR4 family protein [Marinifilum sp. N1E240]MPQ49205.1 SMI1/KNR4 family protein [Marinifilum sp. N1E240]